mmetsp:Transcript_6255/g.9565  ORF Transcript_6255/g.9565 Transcript_6255/m.9565 type:complete len:89 (-) Transcript_6255:385-651(-)
MKAFLKPSALILQERSVPKNNKVIRPKKMTTKNLRTLIIDKKNFLPPKSGQHSSSLETLMQCNVKKKVMSKETLKTLKINMVIGTTPN